MFYKGIDLPGPSCQSPLALDFCILKCDADVLFLSISKCKLRELIKLSREVILFEIHDYTCTLTLISLISLFTYTVTGTL